jgi:hypothetical protein
MECVTADASTPPTSALGHATLLSHVASEEVVVLAPGTAWQIPWELLMLGPFSECVLDDRGQMRHVTAGALLASAARHSSPPDSPLLAEDYRPLPTFAPDMTLMDAARLIVETGWDHAILTDPQPRMITPRSVLRSLVAPRIPPVTS